MGHLQLECHLKLVVISLLVVEEVECIFDCSDIYCMQVSFHMINMCCN